MDTPLKNFGPERRKEPRAYTIFVEYSQKDAGSQKIATFVKNISACGICILIFEELKVDTPLYLKIHLFDGEEAIEVKGRVVWTKPSPFLSTPEKVYYEAGIEYVDMDGSGHARILHYVIKSINQLGL